MERSFEAVMVEQCAPTLAGLKPASLFRCRASCGRDAVSRWAGELAPYGLAVRVLKTCPRTGDCLVYLYRPARLRAVLSAPAARTFLDRLGYRTDRGWQSLIEQLSDRLCVEGDFPHEIGLFLGYPLEDVVGFIKTAAGTTPAAGAGRPTATRRGPGGGSTPTAAAQRRAGSGSGGGRPSRNSSPDEKFRRAGKETTL